MLGEGGGGREEEGGRGKGEGGRGKGEGRREKRYRSGFPITCLLKSLDSYKNGV